MGQSKNEMEGSIREKAIESGSGVFLEVSFDAVVVADYLLRTWSGWRSYMMEVHPTVQCQRAAVLSYL